MDTQNKSVGKKGGRTPKADPATFRYSISLTAEENAKFLSLFEQSGMKIMAHFITACVFQKTVKTIKIDKINHDYYVKLSELFSQFRAIGVNYNQVVKILYRNFSEKKAAAFLYKLEKQTMELAKLSKEIIQLTQQFEQRTDK